MFCVTHQVCVTINTLQSRYISCMWLPSPSSGNLSTPETGDHITIYDGLCNNPTHIYFIYNLDIALDCNTQLKQ